MPRAALAAHDDSPLDFHSSFPPFLQEWEINTVTSIPFPTKIVNQSFSNKEELCFLSLHSRLGLSDRVQIVLVSRTLARST